MAERQLCVNQQEKRLEAAGPLVYGSDSGFIEDWGLYPGQGEMVCQVPFHALSVYNIQVERFTFNPASGMRGVHHMVAEFKQIGR